MNRNTTTTARAGINSSGRKLLCAFLLTFLSVNIATAQNKEPEPGSKTKVHYGEAAAKVIPGAAFVRQPLTTPYPSFARMEPSARITLNEFFPFLRQHIKSNTAIAFKMVKEDEDEIGIRHYRYVQTYMGIPIEKSTYLVHVKENAVTSFNGLALDVPQGLTATPVLNEADALEKAKQFVGSKKYKWEDDLWTNDLKTRTGDPNATYFPKGELCWHVGDDDRTFKLAYRYDIHSADPDKIQRVYVDAASGEILQNLPLESNCSATTVNTIFNGTRAISTDKFTANDFRLRDDCQSAEIWIRDWGGVDLTNDQTEIQNTTNTWTTMNERFGATVLWETKQCYNYYLNIHSRNSYDDANGDVNGYINAIFDCSPPAGCTTANNASMSFSGGTMKVGLSSAGTLANSYATVDIIGHEYTHAVTGSSAQLVYANEPGALNESFSDIFGEVIENYVLGSNDWLLGDERTNGFIRSMSNPNAAGDPDTYLGTNWFTGTGDNGGVHTNSGVQNFWFYLLTVGGTGTNDNNDDYTVSGIGLTKARAIAYRNLTEYLGTNSQYSDARDGAIQSAIDLYGVCSDETKQTTNAWYAVGVGEPFFDAETSVTSNYNGRDVSCHNSCDGSATVTVTSGVLPVYDWSTGATTQSVSNLCPGTYSVTVTNILGLGCSVTKEVTIENTPDLTVAPAATSNYNGYNVSCNGGANGTAAANAAGGTPPYSYSWSNGQTTASASGLSATTYSVVVTDANGCSDSGTVTLTEPPALTIEAGNNQTVFYGYPDSACADLNATNIGGGVAPYEISWSTGANTPGINVCPATSTTYYVTVTDANGCSMTDSVLVCAIDVRCGNNMDKVIICHGTNGASNPITLCVSLGSATNHILSHGDQLATCGTDKSCPPAPMPKSTTVKEQAKGDVYMEAFPNPFTEQTTVRFRLTTGERVELTVTDITGREIAALFNETTKADKTYEVTLNGNQLPAGVYFLTLKTEAGESYVKKIVLAK